MNTSEIYEFLYLPSADKRDINLQNNMKKSLSIIRNTVITFLLLRMNTLAIKKHFFLILSS